MYDRIKIAQCTTVHPRTDTRILVKQCRSLATRYPQTALFVGDGLGDKKDKSTSLEIIDIGAYHGRNRLMRMIRQPLKMFSHVRKKKPRIVHIHDPELIPMALLLKILGHKIVYDVHENLPQQILSKHWIASPLRKPIASMVNIFEQLTARAFNAIVAATPTIAKNFPAKKTIVVQNFPLQSEFNTQTGPPYKQRPLSIAYIGGITKVRGAIEMIKSLDHLSDIQNLKLHLAGKIDPMPLRQQLSNMPGWTNVIDHGFVGRNEVTNILGQVRAGLVLLHPTPAYLDSLPVKMFEYMASGLPVIASDFPLWRKIIEETRCGLLVDPSKPDEIAQAIRWIIKNPDEAMMMGERGRESIATTYNWRIEAEKLFTLYEKLLDKK